MMAFSCSERALILIHQKKGQYAVGALKKQHSVKSINMPLILIFINQP